MDSRKARDGSSSKREKVRTANKVKKWYEKKGQPAKYEKGGGVLT
jgi:hypothetical protein